MIRINKFLLDSNSNDALTLKHTRLLRFFMWWYGGWPGKVLGEKESFLLKLHRAYVVTEANVALLGEIYFLYSYIHDVEFYTLSHHITVMFLTVSTAFRVVMTVLPQYSVIMKKFYYKFHLIHHRHKSEYHQEVYDIIHKISSYFSVFWMSMMVIGVMLFNTVAWYYNWLNGFLLFPGEIATNFTTKFSLEMVCYIKLPGIFDPYDHFTTATIYNIYAGVICAVSVCCLDLLITLMILQTMGHLMILQNSLKILPHPKKKTMIRVENQYNQPCDVAVEYFDEEENRIAFNCILSCVHHHREICEFMEEDMSNFFGPLLALNYFVHLVSCCLLLLQCTRSDMAALFRFGPLTAIIFGQLTLVSVSFELINTMSSKLVDEIYCMPWECLNNPNRRIYHIFFKRLQTPIQITALGLTTVGVTTMVGILKTTFSYFTFLRTMV